jgi:hypothetical protein
VRRALLLSLLVLLALAPSSVADRRPTTRERPAIIHATGRPAYPSGWSYLVVRIDTFGGKWAVVFVKPTKGHEHQVQADWAVAYKRRGRWRGHGAHCGALLGVPWWIKQDLRLPDAC